MTKGEASEVRQTLDDPEFKVPEPDLRWWWWAATLPLSSLFGLEVTFAVTEAVPSDWLDAVAFSFPILAGVMSGVGLQHSFHLMTNWWRADRKALMRQLVPQPPRSVLIRVGGAACMILGGLLFMVGIGIVHFFQESHPGFFWELVSGELGGPVLVLPGVGLIAVGIRLFKGTWPMHWFE